MVTDHPLATQVGIDILKQGGNAVDAAIAVQFALAVVLPEAGNIGGGGFLLYRPARGEVEALDYREQAPAAATPARYRDEQGAAVPGLSQVGHLACGVPGTVDGMWQLHQRHGSLPWPSLIEPAVQLAGRGFALTALQARRLNEFRETFVVHNGSPVDFVKRDPWQAGDRIRQYDLVRSLQRIQQQGRAGFYAGETADLIVEEMARAGGLISHQDLQQYQAQWRTPYRFQQGDRTLYTLPFPCSGGLALQQILGMIEALQVDLSQLGHNSDAYVHLLAELSRYAFADRAYYGGDTAVPTEALASAAYLRARAQRFFDPNRATPSGTVVGAGQPAEPDHTTHYNIVDAAGNAIAVTTTLNGLYGSGVVVGFSGFLLNNQLDDFVVNPYHIAADSLAYGRANLLRPGHRPLSSMTPTLITRAGQTELLLGAAGGRAIISAVLQLYLNVTVFGLDLQRAVAAPRFHHAWLPDELQLEAQGFDPSTLRRLEARGHQLRRPDHIALLNAIRILPDGSLQLGVEPRSDAVGTTLP